MSQTNNTENFMKRPIRIGIIGMGNRAIRFVDFFSKNPGHGRIVALCDSIKEKAELFKEEYSIRPDIYISVEKMVEEASIEVLFVTTSDFAHVQPSVSALNKGIHVFCEKPMAITVDDCDTIIKAAKKSKAVFYLGFNLRHSPVYNTIHKLIESGRLGRINTIEANEYYYEGKTYFRRWNRFRKLSGGLWLTKAAHDFDLLNYMTGSKPKKVYAVGKLSYYNPKPGAAKQCRYCKFRHECPDYYDVLNLVEADRKFINKLRLISEEHGQEPGDLCLYNSEKDTFDNGMAILTYENGVQACYTLNVITPRTTRQMRVVGTEAAIEADLEQGIITLTERHTRKEEVYNLKPMMKSTHGGSDSVLINDFLATVKQCYKPITGWEEGKLAVQVSLAARESMDKGIAIDIPDCCDI